MSHAATKWAFDQPRHFSDMKPNEWAVLMVLADCHNPAQGCYPSQDYICASVNLTERAVRDQLDRLRARRLVDWEVAREHGRRGTNRYRLAFESDFEPANPAGVAAGNDRAIDDVDGAQGCGAQGLPANFAGSADEPSIPANHDSLTGKSRQSNRQILPLHKEEPVKEPVKEPLREACARGQAGESPPEAAGEDDPKAIDRAFRRIAKSWPGFDGMPKEPARRAFHALDAPDRRDAVRKFQGWLQLLKAQRKRHVPAPSTYFGERLWRDVPEPAEADRPRTALARPFGPDWGAARMASLLAGPSGPEPQLTATERRMIEAGKFALEDLLADKRTRTGWPDVNAMHERAEARAGIAVPLRFAGLGAAMEPVPVGSSVFEGWRALHAARGWPWIPDPGALPVAWFPAGGPGGLGEFEAALRAAKGGQ